ncbi:MAG: thiolase family protein [Smithella sp.]
MFSHLKIGAGKEIIRFTGNKYVSDLFDKVKKIKPEDVEAVYVGTSNQSGCQNELARFSWLAGGFPESVPQNHVNMQCPSGMAATEHAARAILADEGDIYIAAGVEDMQHVPMGHSMEWPKRLFEKYNMNDLMMGVTAEKVAEVYNISRKDMENMAYWSNMKAAQATKEGKFKREIVPIEGEKEDGTKFMVDTDQWIREDITMEKMATMQSPFKPGGVVTAATSSPLSTGAAAMLLMERNLADKLGHQLSFKICGRCHGRLRSACNGDWSYSCRQKSPCQSRSKIEDIDIWELNEAFCSQALAIVRELGIEENAPFKNVNIWGGATALGHPLGESGCRLSVTLNTIMKTERKDARYGCATLCGGWGIGNAILWENVHK